MIKDQAAKIIEALLYMTDHPLSFQELAEILEDGDWGEPQIKELTDEIVQKWSDPLSPLQIVHVAGGIQMATKPELSSWIRRLYKERLTVRLSASALETLSIIAYKQPIARSDIEQIRGVEATGVIETLLERRLIKVVGRKETIGRPLLYGTTPDFLRHFGLNHLTDLPDLESLMPPKETQMLINVNKANSEEFIVGEQSLPENELSTVEATTSPDNSQPPPLEPIENS